MCPKHKINTLKKLCDVKIKKKKQDVKYKLYTHIHKGFEFVFECMH